LALVRHYYSFPDNFTADFFTNAKVNNKCSIYNVQLEPKPSLISSFHRLAELPERLADCSENPPAQRESCSKKPQPKLIKVSTADSPKTKNAFY
jgi:hypothetical protein